MADTFHTIKTAMQILFHTQLHQNQNMRFIAVKYTSLAKCSVGN